MDYLKSNSVDLVVTSPPYPMISMWDKMFNKQNKMMEKKLEQNDGKSAFQLMHKELDKVWSELYRVLKPGAIACINIGDATRTLNSNFQLYPNHSRIINYCFGIGFEILPAIIWRKQTNAPNKFMGSGMLPVGAYVTLEHEYILIFRKNSKRLFKTKDQKLNRRESSFFWEERNLWFSDIWFDIKGTNQKLLDKETRKRSAAFPFELVYRLINMYSVKGDTILDPFLGTGTTSLAAMVSERNSVGIEIEKDFSNIINKTFNNVINISNKAIDKRIKEHEEFLNKRKGKEFKHRNKKYGFSVVSNPEEEIVLNKIAQIEKLKNNIYEVSYK
ncbi:site-specific DNA-methyltransferase [Candidatus Roizmanbacteria bacterium]|nr:site-specific DNA-methyltransferase [Candidatus Roizmanbacteria bacterium]